jgi:hypothetical protein
MSYTEPDYNRKRLKVKVMIGIIALLLTISLFFTIQYIFSVLMH